jgi:hypothetical protein
MSTSLYTVHIYSVYDIHQIDIIQIFLSLNVLKMWLKPEAWSVVIFKNIFDLYAYLTLYYQDKPFFELDIIVWVICEIRFGF